MDMKCHFLISNYHFFCDKKDTRKLLETAYGLCRIIDLGTEPCNVCLVWGSFLFTNYGLVPLPYYSFPTYTSVEHQGCWNSPSRSITSTLTNTRARKIYNQWPVLCPLLSGLLCKIPWCCYKLTFWHSKAILIDSNLDSVNARTTRQLAGLEILSQLNSD